MTRRPLSNKGEGVVKDDTHPIWSNRFDFSFACDQFGHKHFKGVMENGALWSLSPNRAVLASYIRT